MTLRIICASTCVVIYGGMVLFTRGSFRVSPVAPFTMALCWLLTEIQNL